MASHRGKVCIWLAVFAILVVASAVLLPRLVSLIAENRALDRIGKYDYDCVHGAFAWPDQITTGDFEAVALAEFLVEGRYRDHDQDDLARLVEQYPANECFLLALIEELWSEDGQLPQARLLLAEELISLASANAAYHYTRAGLLLAMNDAESVDEAVRSIETGNGCGECYDPVERWWPRVTGVLDEVGYPRCLRDDLRYTRYARFRGTIQDLKKHIELALAYDDIDGAVRLIGAGTGMSDKLITHAHSRVGLLVGAACLRAIATAGYASGKLPDDLVERMRHQQAQAHLIDEKSRRLHQELAGRDYYPLALSRAWQIGWVWWVFLVSAVSVLFVVGRPHRAAANAKLPFRAHVRLLFAVVLCAAAILWIHLGHRSPQSIGAIVRAATADQEHLVLLPREYGLVFAALAGVVVPWLLSLIPACKETFAPGHRRFIGLAVLVAWFVLVGLGGTLWAIDPTHQMWLIVSIALSGLLAVAVAGWCLFPPLWEAGRDFCRGLITGRVFQLIILAAVVAGATKLCEDHSYLRQSLWLLGLLAGASIASRAGQGISTPSEGCPLSVSDRLFYLLTPHAALLWIILLPTGYALNSRLEAVAPDPFRTPAALGELPQADAAAYEEIRQSLNPPYHFDIDEASERLRILTSADVARLLPRLNRYSDRAIICLANRACSQSARQSLMATLDDPNTEEALVVRARTGDGDTKAPLQKLFEDKLAEASAPTSSGGMGMGMMGPGNMPMGMMTGPGMGPMGPGMGRFLSYDIGPLFEIAGALAVLSADAESEQRFVDIINLYDSGDKWSKEAYWVSTLRDYLPDLTPAAATRILREYFELASDAAFDNQTDLCFLPDILELYGDRELAERTFLVLCERRLLDEPIGPPAGELRWLPAGAIASLKKPVDYGPDFRKALVPHLTVDSIGALKKGLGATDEDVQAFAVAQLERLGYVWSAEELRRLREDDSWKVRLNACFVGSAGALTGEGDESALVRLVAGMLSR